MRKVAPVTPGEMLEEEFLKPLGLSKYRLAKEIGVPAQRIGEIVAGKRSITADTDLRLCRYFGLSDGWWLRGQTNYDMAIARESMGEAFTKIQRCREFVSWYHNDPSMENRGGCIDDAQSCMVTWRAMGREPYRSGL